MAGHSQFKNIMHKKGKQDAIRSKLFSKLAREITVAAKLGMPDPAMNPRLRAAVLAARAENMPKDNIERAIKKASGGDSENYDEVRYEGYAPGGVAVIVEALTDNRNRTAGEVRSYFTKAGGSLAETGAVSFLFDRVGMIVFDRKVADEDAMLEAAIEAGADDVVSGPEEHEVITSVEALADAQKALETQVRRAAQGRAGLAAAEHDRRGRRGGREDPAPDRPTRGQRRRPERHREFRGLGRAGRQDGRLSLRGPRPRLRFGTRSAPFSTFALFAPFTAENASVSTRESSVSNGLRASSEKIVSRKMTARVRFFETWVGEA